MDAHKMLFAIDPRPEIFVPRICFDGSLTPEEAKIRRSKNRYREVAPDRITDDMATWLDRLEKLLREKGPQKAHRVCKQIGIPWQKYAQLKFVATQRLPLWEDDGEMGLL